MINRMRINHIVFKTFSMMSREEEDQEDITNEKRNISMIEKKCF
jgi:hypothetical protein